MTAFIGILLLVNAHGATIMQPLPQLPNTICVAEFGAKTAQCWSRSTPIDGTTGFRTSPFTINLQVSK